MKPCSTCGSVPLPTMQDHECDDECLAEEHRSISRILNIKPEPGEACALCDRVMPEKVVRRAKS